MKDPTDNPSKKGLVPEEDRTSLALPAWDPSLTPLQVRFLNALALGGSVSRACRSCVMARANPYRWADKSVEFRDAMEEARDVGIQRLEDWALQRAMDDDNPSDRLTEFLLKAHRPHVYRERVDHHIHGQVEHKKRVILESADDTRVISPGQILAIPADGGGVEDPDQ